MNNDKIDYIVSIPSGEIIYVSDNEIKYLWNLGLIEWSSYYNEFIYQDGYKGEINTLLLSYYKNYFLNKKIGNKFIRDIIIYNGEKISGRDISKLYSKGEILFLISKQFSINYNIYKREELDLIK